MRSAETSGASGTPVGARATERPEPPSDGRYAIFLRGVNVGGITVRMADLRTMLGTLPYEDVATVLASGNAVCRTALGPAEVKLRTEQALRARFGYEAWVVVVRAEDLRAMAASVPPAPPVPPSTVEADGARGADGTDGHTYVTFFSSAESLAAFLDDARALADRPVPLAGGSAVAWFAPRGRSTDVPLAKLLARPRFASTSTTRNITTVTKVLRLLD